MRHCLRSLCVLPFLAVLATAAPATAADPADPADPGTVKRLTDLSQITTIRPGQEGWYGVYVQPAIRTGRRKIGTLGGRVVEEIDSPARVSGMGKYMAMGPDGKIWFVETREDKVVRIDPKTYEIVQYMVPRGAAPYSVAVDGQGVVWLTAHGIEMLLELHPDRGVVFAHQPPHHGFLIHVNVDRTTDTVWFTQPGNNQVVSYHRGAGFKEYPSPTPQSGPGRLDFDSAGNVWFPELYTDKLARLDPRTGVTREWDTPTRNGLPAGVRVDKNDDTIWVSEPMADKLAIFRGEGWVREFPIPTPGSVVSTNVSDEAGFVWFTEGGWRGSAGGNKIGRLDPRTGAVEELALPHENAQPLGMVTGADGSIWFALVTGARVCRILPPQGKERAK